MTRPNSVLTLASESPAVCPDWVTHRDLYAVSETSWRKSPQQKRSDWADGCGWCGGMFTVPQVAEQYLAPDSLPDRVEGIPIGGRHG